MQTNTVRILPKEVNGRFSNLNRKNKNKMIDLRDLIYRQRNRRVGRSAPTRSPGVREMPLGTGGGTPPTNPFNAPKLTSQEEELRQRYAAPPTTQTPNTATVATAPISTRGFGTTDATTPTAAPTAPAPVFGANISPQEKWLRDDIDARRRRRQELENAPINGDDSKLHNFGAGAANALRQVQRTGNSQADLGATVGAAVFGGLRGLFNSKEDDVREQKEQLAVYDKDIERSEKQLDNEVDRNFNRARTQTIFNDDENNKQRRELEREDMNRKVGDRVSREKTSRMNAVAGMFKNLPAYDPNDPRFAEITEALGDVNLPITPKDAKKNVKLIQDQRSGAWATILTDPITGKQETRAVLDKDGKEQFKSTPTVVMQGEYGMLKQDDQQKFTGEQNEQSRAIRRQQLSDARSRFAEMLNLRKQSLELRKQALESRDTAAAAKAQVEAEKYETYLKNLKVNWQKKIDGKNFTQEDYDELTADMP